jgi:Zn-dependent peptidase ImmA (M78 family)
MKPDIQLNNEAISLREEFGIDSHSPVDIFGLIASNRDMTVTFLPMSARISGLCIKSDDVKLIGINSSLTYGRQRFTAAHELYHIFYDGDLAVRICAKELETNETKEQEANKFASFFLAPYGALYNFVRNKLGKRKASLTVEDVVHIEQYFGLSRQATVVRLQQDGYITPEEAGEMTRHVIASAKRLGYAVDLYLPAPEDKQYATYGRYITLVEQLREKQLVSVGKYEELLLDAFRNDIVFGTNTEERYD